MLGAITAKRIASIAKIAISEAYCCNSTSGMVAEERAVVKVDNTDGVAFIASIRAFGTLIFVDTFLILENFEKILDLVLRCLVVFGANVNVKEYAYRCGTPGGNKGSRY